MIHLLRSLCISVYLGDALKVPSQQRLAATSARRTVPNPLTEAECASCEYDVTTSRDGKAQCLIVIQLMQSGAEDSIKKTQFQVQQAETERVQQQGEVDTSRKQLAKLRGEADALRSARTAAVDSVMDGLSLAAQSGGKISDDLLSRYLSCDSQRDAASLDLEACFERLQKEQLRVAAREASYEALRTSREASVASTAAEGDILATAVSQASAESSKTQNNVATIYETR